MVLKARGARVAIVTSTELMSAHAEDRAAQRLDIESALQRLSRRQRLAIECRYFVDLNISDIAAVMNCSEGTVKSTLADARARLRKLLEVTG